MKIHILNDLHIEFGDFVPPVVDAVIYRVNPANATQKENHKTRLGK